MVTIRDANSDDLEAICEFNGCMAAETEDVALEPERLREGVHRVLDDPGRGRYFVAEMDGRVIGQTMITFEWSDWRNGWFWWLQSVYVHPEARGGGVFRTLLGPRRIPRPGGRRRVWHPSVRGQRQPSGRPRL